MSLLVKDLFELDSLKGIKLMTDLNGIENEITWFNIMEILDEISYLQKGELLLTTGFKLDDKTLNKDLIYKLHIKGLAGMGIQTGYYLDEIPDYIIEDGNKYSFPIFKIPKNLSFSIITHVVLKNAYNINIKFDQNNLQRENYIFENLSLGKGLSFKEKSEISKNLNLDSSSNLCLLILCIKNAYDSIIPEGTTLNTLNKLRNYFHAHSIVSMVEISENKVLFLTSSKSNLKIYNLTSDLTNLLKKCSEEDTSLTFTVGGSSIFNSLNNIDIAYKEAYSSLTSLEQIKAKTGLCFYEHLGLFKALGLINSDKHIFSLLQEKIKPLLDYDKLHKTSYFYTLKTFLSSGCNLNATSEKMYIHRHTLRNRLDKIQRLCNFDFDDYYIKSSLIIAVYLHDLFT